VAVLTINGAGAAFAYWTSTGTGSASTGTSVPFTITSATAVGTIAPGSAGQTVPFNVTNPGPVTQSLTGVTVTMGGPTGDAWVPAGGCLIADYTATISTPPTFGPVAAAGTVTGTATVTLAATALNQDDCKNQTVPLYFLAS
jgi:hypothetical protein